MTDPETILRVMREAREREATLRLPLDGEIFVGPPKCLDKSEPNPCPNNPRAQKSAGRGLCSKHLKRLERRVNAGETTWLAEETAGRCKPAQRRGESSPWRRRRRAT